jgi:glycosyltransferase involved in cell wall biosynthesis
LVVLNFGLLHPKNVTGWRRFLWKTFLPAADSVISLVEGQISEVKRAFGVPARMQFYVPLGVDTDFVREGVSEPQEAAACESGFVLAVGTNEGKDYGTLLEALPLGLKLVIITDEHNARLIRRHRCFGEGIEVLTRVPMRQLRDWYHRAALMVIPLHDTAYGSGHSVFLENLALGKLVVVSESRGMKGYARSKQNCLTVPVGDSKGLRETIQSVMNATGHYCGLGEAAGKDAVENFGIKKFASRVADILLDAIRCAGGQDRLRALDGRQRGGGKEEQKCMSLGN